MEPSIPQKVLQIIEMICSMISSLKVSLGNPTWFFYAMALLRKPPLETFILKSVDLTAF